MSCQFKVIASIVDVDKLKSLLYAADSINSAETEVEDSWGWTVEEPPPENWLDECSASLSPSSEVLAFARARNLVILTGKWDANNDGQVKYHISWSGDLTQHYSERITSVLCLPLAGQGKFSSHGGADWTAIAVGFSTGSVRFYTDNGNLLLSEVLHEEPVKVIKCQSFQPSANSQGTPQADELLVTHLTVVCCIQGFALCNSLKACRNQLARVEANCSEKIEAPPLSLTKWGLPDQEEIVDAEVLGSSVSTVFNHLTTASLRGGYFSTYRSGPPQVTTVLGTGSSPFLAWHGLVEGTAGPILTDVAKAVASKLKSAIGSAVPGWLGVSRKTHVEKTKEKDSLQPTEVMVCRFGMCDHIRKGLRICMSPQKNFSAVCDSLGRITLVDNMSGIAIRMWKGYRDAECAFIPVGEDSSSGQSRKALYLAIYAPKKSMVEVWALQQGPKIVSFVATKNGRLLYIRHGLLGANNISHKHVNATQHPCVYICSSGEIKQVCVPFHLILSNKNDPRNRDIYLFKQIKKLLRTSYDNSSTEIPELCSQMTTEEIKLQVLETAASSKHITPETMLSILNEFQKHTDDTEPETEIAAKLRLGCDNYRKLVTLYTKVLNCLDAPPAYSTVVPSSPTDEEEILSKILMLSAEEVQRLRLLVSFSPDRSKVSFKTVENRFHIFVSSFSNVSSSKTLSFTTKVTSDAMSAIGEVLCQCVLYGGCSLADWRELALESDIDPRFLLYSAVAYWLKKPLGTNMRSEMSLYVQLLFLTTSLVCMKDSLAWWGRVRSLITESQNSLNALTTTIISRAVYLRTEKQIVDDGLLDEDDDDWETISRETCLWSELLLQVEAVAVVQSALSCKPKLKDMDRLAPPLEYVTPDISLSNLILKGPGLVAELVAKHVSSWGMQPEWFLNLDEKTKELKTDDNQSFLIDASAEVMTTTSWEDVVFQRLGLIRKYFPYSLSASHILANICWEYVLTWTKEPNKNILLTTGLNSLSLIPDNSLKIGLCSVLWSVHLKTHFENIVKLLQKIGKLPKDRLCEQHANVTANNVKHVLQSLVDFHRIFMEAASCSEEETLNLKKEAIWSYDCQPSLVDISLAQGEPHMHILRVHNLCVRALLLIAVFPIRLYRPVTSLLHKREELMLWMDIQNSDCAPAATPDDKLEETRLTFLLKVIKAATDSLCSKGASIEDAAHWIGQCYFLADEWDVPVDVIRVQHVINLYKNNGDRYAEEVIGTVTDKASLGKELLTIVGQRMKKLILNSSTRLKERLAHLSPAISNWIDEQEESNDVCEPRDIQQLSALVVSLLPESCADYKFAGLLLEGILPQAS